ncbi:MAG: RNA-directed DNA polymerase [Actinomycetota bacterium]
MSIEIEHVPKPGGGSRTIVRPSPDLRRALTAAIAPHTERIEAALGPEAHANRAGGHARVLEPWRPARARFERAARRLVADVASAAGTVAVTDVRRCYASISPEVVEARLRALRIEPAEVLRRLAPFERAGVPGLPVGPAASAIIANAVLAHVDDRIRSPDVRHLRWVDDIVVVARNPGAFGRALDRIEDALGELGLTIAEEKTAIATGPGAARLLAWSRRSGTGTPL